jgi:hypothetical protein
VRLSVLLTAAIAALPLLPPEHVHPAGIEGRSAPIAHAHAPEWDAIAGGNSSTATLHAPHGNHAFAIFLSTDYTTASAFTQQPVAIVAAAPVMATMRVLGSAHIGTAQTIHGPPGSVPVTRGPPSLS